MDLKGIFVPITTAFTNNKLNLDEQKRHVSFLLQFEIEGIVLLGTTGEFPHVTLEERLALIAGLVKIVSPKKLIVGTGALTTEQAIHFTKMAKDEGAHAALVISPYYFSNGMNDSVLEKYFLTIADKSSLPIILYNIPSCTGYNLSPGLVKKLCNHPMICGIKDSSGNIQQSVSYLHYVSNLTLLVGSSSNLFLGLCMGASGGILAEANFVPDICCEIYKSFKSGDLDKARQKSKTLTVLDQEIFSRYGVSGVKAAMQWLGFNEEVHEPLLELSINEKNIIREILLSQDVKLKSVG